MKSIVFGLALLFSSSASADAFLKLGLMYMKSESGTTTMTESSRTMYDITGAYQWPSGMALGLTYANEQQKSGTTSEDRTSYGPTFGWAAKGEGFYILGTYFFKSTQENYVGNGYQLDGGYKFKFSSVGLGLQFSYKKFEYNELNGTKLNPTYKRGFIDPYFTLWFEF